VWLVELAPVTDAVDIAPTVLGSLGLRESQVLERRPERRARDAMERLLDALLDASCLLVIDNCELVVDGVADVVDSLLARCPGLRVLATSREPLGIAGESLCVLRSLELPAAGSTAQEALQHESVQLFVDRAAAVRADFTVDATTVDDVVEIVGRLDGLPLAIELAAARLRVLPVSEVAARLGDRFTLLTGGSRTALPRHRTLRAVVQWSWDLLSPAERTLAERLAVFPSGATVKSAVAICSDPQLPADELPALLDALVDKSLLQLTDGPGLRYRMLETIREFGLEQLAARGEVHDARAAHARYFADLAAEADPHLRQRDQLEWLALLEVERDNILGALKFLGDTGEAAAAVELAMKLTWYWTLLGSHSEAATWLRFALAVPGEVPQGRRVMAHAALTISSVAGEPSELDATDLRDTMADLDAKVADVDLGDEPLAVLLRPILAIFAGDSALVEERMAEAFSCGDPWVSAAAHVMAANIAENAGDVETMRREATAALREFSALGDRWGLAGTFSSLGLVRMLDGDLEDAADAYRQAARHLEELGAVGDTGMIKMRLASVLVRLGRVDEARRTLNEAAAYPGRGGGDDTLFLIGELSVAMAMEDDDATREAARRLTERLDGARPRPGMGHLHATALAVLAEEQLVRGDVDGAEQHLVESYVMGLSTHDMPILAAIGLTVAYLARARGLHRLAAVVLGAAAQLRGADDFSDIRVRRLLAELRETLGDDVDIAYDEGRHLPRAAALDRIDPQRLAGSVEA
jgi:predicted ATPase